MNKSLLELFEVSGKNDFEFTYKIVEEQINILNVDLENKKEHGTQIVKENELVERWANYKNFYGIRVSLRKRRNNNR